MENFIKILQSFNSKERFFLIRKVLGNKEFNLSEKFREELFGILDLPIPQDVQNVFVAMDYHLDWLYASLVKTFNNELKPPFSNKDKAIKGHQEDIDFIIVFESDRKFNVILIEAKGVTGWTNKQLNSKAKRLIEIFGKEGNRWKKVIPHFITLSPKPPPKKIKILNNNTWLRPDIKKNWLKLPLPKDLKKVSRCNKESESDKNGEYWIIEKRPF